jgi:hypothetical protein
VIVELDKAEFEKGKPARALYDRILEFLAVNRGEAYTEGDIGKEMMQAEGGDPVLQSLTVVGRQAVVLAALDDLIREGKVVARKHGWNTYCMYGNSGAVSRSPSTKPE